VIEFLAKNSIWFLIIAVMLVFALIGYVIDQKQNGIKSEKTKKLEKEKENIETIANPNMTLGEALTTKKEDAVNIQMEPVVLETKQDDEMPEKLVIDEPDA